MKAVLCTLVLLGLAFGSDAATKYNSTDAVENNHPWVIASGGNSYSFPPQTMAAYKSAIKAGADGLACTIAVTKDLELICAPSPLLSSFTDANKKYPKYIRTYSVYGKKLTGVFAWDLTLNQTKTLRTKQPNTRRFQGLNFQGAADFRIPAVDEVFELALATKPAPAVWTEIVWGKLYNGLTIIKEANEGAGTSISELVQGAYEAYNYYQGYAQEVATWLKAPSFVASREVEVLQVFFEASYVPTVQILDVAGRKTPDTKVFYKELATADGLAEVAAYAYAIAAPKESLIKVTKTVVKKKTKTTVAPSTLVADARTAGLQVFAYPFARDVYSSVFGSSDAELAYFFGTLQVDGVLTDSPRDSAEKMDSFLASGFKFPKVVTWKNATEAEV